MKKISFLLGVLSSYTIFPLHAQTITLSPPQVLAASTLFTNDNESMTVTQTIANFPLCSDGSTYTVPSIHASATIFSYSAFTFQPGYLYTFQLNGSATASGDLSNPGASTIYWGFSRGLAQTTTSDINSACAAFPNGSAISGYKGSITVSGPFISPSATSTVDLSTAFLLNPQSVGSFPNSATASNSAIPSFVVVASPVTGFNIEAFPVLGDRPTLIAENNCGGNSNPTTVPPTNTTLNINSVTITQTPYITTTPLINATTSVIYNSAGVRFSNGIITAPPGTVVSLNISALGGKPIAQVTTNCSINTPGVVFNTGSSTASVSNGLVQAKTITVSFTMPATGYVNFSGNISSSNQNGSGSISIN